MGLIWTDVFLWWEAFLSEGLKSVKSNVGFTRDNLVEHGMAPSELRKQKFKAFDY